MGSAGEGWPALSSGTVAETTGVVTWVDRVHHDFRALVALYQALRLLAERQHRSPVGS